MKIISVFVVWVFAALSLKAQGEWIVENLDPITNLRTGVIRVNRNDYRIGPSADLNNADLSGADLSGADLRGASLIGGLHFGTNFSGANLSGTVFSGNNASGANFFGADLNNATMSGLLIPTVINSVSRGHSEEIQALKTSDTTNTAAIATNTAATAANTTNITENTTRIEAIEAQIALLAEALAAKDAEIAEKNERIAQLEEAKDERIAFLEDAKVVDVVRNLLDEKDDEIAILEQRPTQTEFDTVVKERDARPTPEEIQDARTGSVILTPSEDGTVKLKLEIEESADLEVWSNEGKKLEALIPLAEGKKFLRFALAAQD